MRRLPDSWAFEYGIHTASSSYHMSSLVIRHGISTEHIWEYTGAGGTGRVGCGSAACRRKAKWSMAALAADLQKGRDEMIGSRGTLVPAKKTRAPDRIEAANTPDLHNGGFHDP
jgi:hypothetical protein